MTNCNFLNIILVNYLILLYFWEVVKVEKNIRLPKDFFSVEREIITVEEALKDVIPVDWDSILENWEDSEDQAIILYK